VQPACLRTQEISCLKCHFSSVQNHQFRPNFRPNFVQNCEFRFFVQNAKVRDFVHFSSKTNLLCRYQSINQSEMPIAQLYFNDTNQNHTVRQSAQTVTQKVFVTTSPPKTLTVFRYSFTLCPSDILTQGHSLKAPPPLLSPQYPSPLHRT